MSEPRRSGARRADRAPRATLPKLSFDLGALAAVAVLAALVLVLLAPAQPGGVPKPSSATGEPVTRTALGCPQSPAPAGVSSRYAVVSAEVEGLGQDGSVTGAPRLDRGEAAELTGSRVTGIDGLAQGLFAWRADTGRTTAVAPCSAPRANWWFTGVGASLEHESTLVLDNLDDGPAEVDVRVLSPDGELDLSDSGGTGISVRPGGHVVLSLVQLAPQNEELAVNVHATRGRVVAAVQDRFAMSPTAAPGYEWVPSQIEPERTVRLAGVPARPKSRTLLIANPSPSEAVVSVELDGPSGRVLPPGLEQLSVEPGSLATVKLDALVAEDVAVRLRADRPIVASVRSVVAGGDVVYGGPAAPVSAAGALPVVGPSVVHLTALATTARATVTAYAATGEDVDTTTISLALHETATWRVPKGAAYVVVKPTQGTVVGAMVYDGRAAVPFQELPSTVVIPVVRPAA